MATPVPPRCDADHNFCDDSERFRKATAGGLLAFRSHPNERGTERAEAESVLCLCACAVAAVVRARLRTALIEGHLAIVDPLFVARLAAEPLLGGAEMPSNEPDLFALDVRGFEDRPPLLDLSLVVGGERLRILILARRNLLAEIGEPLAHAGIG